jgi:hypothetical protein
VGKEISKLGCGYLKLKDSFKPCDRVWDWFFPRRGRRGQKKSCVVIVAKYG